MEGAGENPLLIVGNIQEQFAEKRLGTLRISGIKDPIAAIQIDLGRARRSVRSRIRPA
jgi:hypothetical protein